MQVGRRTVIKLRGAVPSKKNEKFGKAGGGVFYRRDMGGKHNTRAELAALEMQARAEWRKVSTGTAKRPQISMLFVIPAKSPDPDNMQTTVLDVLKKAGVIVDDKAAALTSPLVCRWEIRAQCEPETFVEIQEAA